MVNRKAMISVVIPTIGSHTLEQFEEAISSALVSPELISQVCIMDNSKNEVSEQNEILPRKG